MTNRTRLALFFMSFALSGCGSFLKSGNSYTAGTAYDLSKNANYLTVTGSESNIMSVDVGVCGGTLNIPCATVTICEPGSTTACQTIPNLLVDTGSYGLRVFSSLLTNITLTPETSGSNDVGECVSYLDGSADWGKVAQADVYLGGSSASMMKAASVPIELINASWPSSSAASANCPYTLDTSPASTGFNGILGVGLFVQDCGTNCSGNSGNGMYYSCSSTTCSGYAAPLTSQVSNPVASLGSGYNNGIAMELPGVPSTGAVSAPGYMIFGVGTQSGGSGIASNTPSSTVSVYTADTNGDMDTIFNGNTYSSFVDSGSNGLYFPGPSSLAVCSGSLSPFYCPNSITSLSATNYSYSSCPGGICTGSGVQASLSIASASDAFDTSNPNTVFNNLGGNLSGEFDWGLPFFLGRTVFIGIDGKAATINSAPYTGPYFAF